MRVSLFLILIILLFSACEKDSEDEQIILNSTTESDSTIGFDTIPGNIKDYRDDFVGSYFGMEYSWHHTINRGKVRDSALKTYSVQKSMNDSFVLIYGLPWLNKHDSVFIDINGEATKLDSNINGPKFWTDWRITFASDSLYYFWDQGPIRDGIGWKFAGAKVN